MFTHSSIESWQQGRWWLHWGDNKSFNIEWRLFKPCGGALEFDWHNGEVAFNIHLAIPFLFSVYFVLRLGWYAFDKNRNIGIRFFDKAIWWCLWMPPDEWSKSDPKWRRGSFHPLDFFWGSPKYTDKTIGGDKTTVDMPEGEYIATYREHIAFWKRSRWPFWKQAHRFDIEMVKPIPMPGKGESAWDLGDDGLYAGTYNAETLDEAIDQMRQSVIKQRERYGGKNWTPDK